MATLEDFKIEIGWLGMGTWGLGGVHNIAGRPNGWASIDLAIAEKTLKQAAELGIRLFDTAPGYGAGESERRLGEIFKGNRNPIFCTKYGMEERGEKVIFDYSAATLEKSVEVSLGRLQREALDILLLHNPPPDFDFAKFDSEPLKKLVKAGKVRFFGVSCNSVASLTSAVKNGFGDVVEFRCNLLSHEMLEAFRAISPRKHYLTIARSALASGLLTERWWESKNKTFPDSDHRKSFSQAFLKSAEEKIKEAKEHSNQSIERIAISHVLAQPEIDVTLIGAHRPNHLELISSLW